MSQTTVRNVRLEAKEIIESMRAKIENNIDGLIDLSIK